MSGIMSLVDLTLCQEASVRKAYTGLLGSQWRLGCACNRLLSATSRLRQGPDALFSLQSAIRSKRERRCDVVLRLSQQDVALTIS